MNCVSEFPPTVGTRPRRGWRTPALLGSSAALDRGKELAQRMMAAMSTERGIHIESLLGAPGALATDP